MAETIFFLAAGSFLLSGIGIGVWPGNHQRERRWFQLFIGSVLVMLFAGFFVI